MEIKQLMKEIKSAGIKDQDLADSISVEGDSVNQCVIYKWREGQEANEILIRRYKRLLEFHKKLKRRGLIKNVS